MSTQPMKRQYIMLKPMVLGASGFARLQVEGGGLLLQLTGKSLNGYGGLRAFLYAGDGAVQELGAARVNPQGQATLLAEVLSRQGSMAPSRLQAVLVTSDDPKPQPLFIGLCVSQSAGSLLDARNALLALCAKLGESNSQITRSRSRIEKEETPARAPSKEGAEDFEQAEREGAKPPKPLKPLKSGKSPVPSQSPQSPEPIESAESSRAPKPTTRFALKTSSAMPRDLPPKEVFLSAVDPSIYVEADVYSTRPPKRGRGADTERAQPALGPPEPRDGEDLQAPALTGPVGTHAPQASTAAADAQEPSLAGVNASEATAAEASSQEAPLQADAFPRPPRPGALPVDRLPKLRWPARWRQLAPFFDQHPPFAPFDMPGWRFVQVPMHRGGSFVVGRMCQDEKVQRVMYALPGQRNQPPPKEFARYRWQQGQDGQGYWALWQQVKAGAER